MLQMKDTVSTRAISAAERRCALDKSKLRFDTAIPFFYTAYEMSPAIPKTATTAKTAAKASLPLPLTPRQQQILDWIRRHLETTGMPPTRAEIATGLGFSTASSAEDHLRALAKKGALEL